MKKRSDFSGYEFDWFAIDADGYIALMSTGGFGAVPDFVFERFAEQREIEMFLSTLIETELSGDCNLEWIMDLLHSAGIFSYDCGRANRPYHRYLVPEEPRRLEELDISVRLRDSFVPIPQRFTACKELSPEAWLPCMSDSDDEDAVPQVWHFVWHGSKDGRLSPGGGADPSK